MGPPQFRPLKLPQECHKSQAAVAAERSELVVGGEGAAQREKNID